MGFVSLRDGEIVVGVARRLAFYSAHPCATPFGSTASLKFVPDEFILNGQAKVTKKKAARTCWSQTTRLPSLLSENGAPGNSQAQTAIRLIRLRLQGSAAHTGSLTAFDVLLTQKNRSHCATMIRFKILPICQSSRQLFEINHLLMRCKIIGDILSAK